jgi:hypothetical protein
MQGAAGQTAPGQMPVDRRQIQTDQTIRYGLDQGAGGLLKAGDPDLQVVEQA